MYLYAQLGEKKLADIIHLGDEQGFLASGTEQRLTYELSLPYDIRVMSSNRYQNEVFRRITALGNNGFSCSQEDHFSQKPPMLPDDTFSFNVFPASSDFACLHRHNYFELMFVLSGTMEQYIEGGRYQCKEGTVCLMNCNTEHAESFSSDYVSVYLCISPTYLRTQLFPYIDSGSPLGLFFQNNTQEHSDFQKDYISFTPQDSSAANRVEQLLNAIASERIWMRPGHHQMISGLILRLLAFLQDSSHYSHVYNKLDSSTEAYIFSKATRAMECSQAPLSRGELAESLNYSSDYINRIIKKYSGMSIIQYNRSIQLKKAEWLLTESDTSISDIIRQLGYENRTHFYRTFQKKHNMTPMEYRLKYSSHGAGTPADQKVGNW